MKLRRQQLFAAAIAAAALLGGVATAQTPEEYKAIQRLADQYLSSLPKQAFYEYTAEELAKKIKEGKGDFVIVDVRVPKDKKYDVSHIPGAIHIPVTDVAKAENLAKLPKGKEVIVHCDTGQQQNKVLTVLRLLGYDAYALKWGYMSWALAPPTALTMDAISGSMTKGYPTVK